MDTYSINPASIIDEAVDLSMQLTSTDFPVSIFPTRIQRIISEVHECHNYPTDYIAAAILTALAVGIGNTHLVQIKQGWVESHILYIALIGRPGANKSHPLSFAMKPFLDYDYQQNQVFEKALAKYDELMSMSRKERTESGEEQFPQEPVRKRFLISDVTPEGLSLIHAQNKRGLCLWADELSAWFKNFNRYNNGSEEQFWLSVFSAKTTMSDRKNAKSSIFIKRPYISVIGTIQNKILNELAKGERSSNGFINRILFVMPNLQQKARWNDKELQEDIEQEWNAIIDKLIQSECHLNEHGEIEPQILFFSEDAKIRLYEWQHHFSELCDRETNDTIVSIYCKLEIYSFIGIRVPVLRKFAKEFAKEAECEFFLQQLPHEYYDENMLHGLLISQIKDYEECIRLTERFLPYIDNWAVCDIMSPKVFAKHKEELLAKIKTWSQSSHVYTCRFGIETLMTHYLDKEFKTEYLEIPASVRSDEYYVKMMVAWFFATALAKQWEATIPYIEQKRLAPWTHNKTIQKSIESYRISPEQKEYLRSLKIK